MTPNWDLINPLAWGYFFLCKTIPPRKHYKITVDGYLRCISCGWPMYYESDKVIMKPNLER